MDRFFFGLRVGAVVVFFGGVIFEFFERVCGRIVVVPPRELLSIYCESV